MALQLFTVCLRLIKNMTKMKKIAFTLLLVLGFAGTTIAQKNEGIALTQGKKELMVSKASGEFEFVLPNTVTQERVEKAAGYYTRYFTVGFDNSSKTASVKMVENTEQNRYVLMRFLSACDVRKVKVDDTELELYNFTEEYLK